MPKKHLEDDFSHIPNVAYVSPLELKPNRVLIGLGVATIIIALGTLGYLLVDKLFLGESATAVPNIEITRKPLVTKVATPNAQKDETADWKTYSNKQIGYQIKIPSSSTFTESEEKIEGWGQIIALLPEGKISHTLMLKLNGVSETGSLLGSKETFIIYSVKELGNTSKYEPKLIAEKFSKIVKGKFSEVNVGILTGYKIELTNQNGFAYWIISGNKDAAFTILTSSDFKNRSTVDNIVSSFKLLE